MKPLAFTWPYALPFWALYVWAFWPEFAIVRRAGKEKTATDAKSFQIIIAGMWAAYLLAFPIAGLRALQFPSHRVFWFWLGLAILVGGSLLRRHCFRTLGASFTGDVKARADQVVITRGAYAFVRHPSYTGGILMNTGIGIALGSWGSALLLFVVSVAVYTYRMNVEEQALLAAIGEPYREFMRTRKRVIPYVY
ncbi:MAG TPA: isoprenylcysteine carboxylmethyltransferase family protein [Candidatus Polarisedimenticolaceae bacterium]|nr:isoprenylcysteine carboxylmethyltransferase family protein [Candidatus Polarisedimenticolaceae bacterium]